MLYVIYEKTKRTKKEKKKKKQDEENEEKSTKVIGRKRKWRLSIGLTRGKVLN